MFSKVDGQWKASIFHASRGGKVTSALQMTLRKSQRNLTIIRTQVTVDYITWQLNWTTKSRIANKTQDTHLDIWKALR